MQRKIISAIVIFCLCSLLFSQSQLNSEKLNSKSITLETLLASYLENDLELKNLIIQKQKAELSKQSAEISNGFDITLSTGTMSVRTSNGKTSFSIKPYIDASLPQYKNLSIKANSNFTAGNSSSSGSVGLSDTSLSVGVDIISDNDLNRKIALLNADRKVTEADWKLANATLTAEKNFYTELKSIFSTVQSILSEKTNLYTDTISFEETKAKGYSEVSSTYRLAQMKVLSDQYNIDSKTRDFNHSLNVFYAKCGITEFGNRTDKLGTDNSSSSSEQSDIDDTLENFLAMFSSQIPIVEPISINDFEKENYAELEAAKWNHQINSLSRSAKNNFSLGANAGYTFGNTSIGGTPSSSSGSSSGGVTRVDTADVGVTSTIGGVKLAGGVSVPVTGDSHAPSFTASATFTPNTFKQNKITKENKNLSEQQELIAIEEAEIKYETTVVDKTQSLRDIEWQKSTNETSLQMYREIEADLKKYFDGGFIKESEYLSAKANVELYTIRKTLNDIDLIIYNNEIQLLFR